MESAASSPAGAPKRKGRRLSISRAVSSLPLPAGQKSYSAKLNGKKVQLQAGGMGLQVFPQKGASTTYMYKTLGSWGETDNGFEITTTDDKTLVFVMSDGGEEICLAMKGNATKLAKATAEAALSSKGSGAEESGSGADAEDGDATEDDDATEDGDATEDDDATSSEDEDEDHDVEEDDVQLAGTQDAASGKQQGRVPEPEVQFGQTEPGIAAAAAAAAAAAPASVPAVSLEPSRAEQRKLERENAAAQRAVERERLKSQREEERRRKQEERANEAERKRQEREKLRGGGAGVARGVDEQNVIGIISRKDRHLALLSNSRVTRGTGPARQRVRELRQPEPEHEQQQQEEEGETASDKETEDDDIAEAADNGQGAGSIEVKATPEKRPRSPLSRCPEEVQGMSFDFRAAGPLGIVFEEMFPDKVVAINYIQPGSTGAQLVGLQVGMVLQGIQCLPPGGEYRRVSGLQFEEILNLTRTSQRPLRMFFQTTSSSSSTPRFVNISQGSVEKARALVQDTTQFSLNTAMPSESAVSAVPLETVVQAPDIRKQPAETPTSQPVNAAASLPQSRLGSAAVVDLQSTAVPSELQTSAVVVNPGDSISSDEAAWCSTDTVTRWNPTQSVSAAMFPSVKAENEIDVDSDDDAEFERSDYGQGPTDEQDIDDDDSNTTSYRVLHRCAVRSDFDVQSAQMGILQPGEVIRALETRENRYGQTRVRFPRGWVSVTNRDDDLLLVPVHLVAVCAAAVREGFALDSRQCGVVQSGEEIYALDARQNQTGQVRVRFRNPTVSGWTSLKARNGITLFVGSRASVGQSSDSASRSVEAGGPEATGGVVEVREVAERRIHDAATVCAAKAAAAEQAALRTEEFAREQIAHIQEQTRLQVESLQLVLAQREREQGERASERVEMEEQQAAARERAHHVSLETQKAGLLAQEKIVQVTLVARKAEEDAERTLRMSQQAAEENAKLLQEAHQKAQCAAAAESERRLALAQELQSASQAELKAERLAAARVAEEERQRVEEQTAQLGRQLEMERGRRAEAEKEAAAKHAALEVGLRKLREEQQESRRQLEERIIASTSPRRPVAEGPPRRASPQLPPSPVAADERSPPSPPPPPSPQPPSSPEDLTQMRSRLRLMEARARQRAARREETRIADMRARLQDMERSARARAARSPIRPAAASGAGRHGRRGDSVSVSRHGELRVRLPAGRSARRRPGEASTGELSTGSGGAPLRAPPAGSGSSPPAGRRAAGGRRALPLHKPPPPPGKPSRRGAAAGTGAYAAQASGTAINIQPGAFDRPSAEELVLSSQLVDEIASFLNVDTANVAWLKLRDT